MLTEERQQLIIQIISEQEIVTVNDLVKILNTSESTIRRDLIVLDQKALIKKIHGGAMSINKKASYVEYQVDYRQNINTQAKRFIGKKAAELITDGDVIYIDAGTTTEQMIDFINAKNVVVVTNGITHISKLLKKGIKTIVIGGTLKGLTEAVIGANAVMELDKYQFNKGFFGTNGVSEDKGYTTPDLEEALVKKKALSKCNLAYVLADHTKINQVNFVNFGALEEATLITDKPLNPSIYKQTTIIEVENND